MICPKCHSTIRDDSTFCSHCSAKVKEINENGNYATTQKNGTTLKLGLIAAVTLIIIVTIVCLTVIALKGAHRNPPPSAEPLESVPSAQEPAAQNNETNVPSEPNTVNNYYYYYTDGVYSTIPGAADDYYDHTSSWEYLWPTDTEYISDSDLDGLSRDTVDAIRNEVYARHGYAFTKKRWQDYFDNKSWYVRNENVTANTVNDYLSDLEKKNIETIVKYEKAKGWY